MSSTTPPHKIVLLGANGHLGPFILSTLQKDPTNFSVTVLSRKSSKSTYPPSTPVKLIPDDLTEPSSLDTLTTLLRGFSALVIAIPGSSTAVSKTLITAAHQAGVPRVIPADFGSCDSTDPRVLELIPLYPAKKVVREHCEALARSGGFSWTSIVCGHFLDYGLPTGLLAVDLKGGKIRVFDGGDIKFSLSMLRTVAEGVRGVLLRPGETQNKVVYVHSVSVTQNELKGVLERVTGKTFETEEWSSDEYIRVQKGLLREKPGDHDVTENLVSVEGVVNADWRGKKEFVNGLLGLPEEDLEGLVRECLKL